jgi:hypothetical protein
MNWQDLDAKRQRKALILGVLVVVALVVLLSPSGTSHARSAPPVITQPVAQTGRGTTPPLPPPVPPPAKDARLLGTWQSVGTPLPNHGLCTLTLELARNSEQAGSYTGAATLTCIPIGTLMAPKPTTPMEMLIDGREALHASLTGTWQKDVIVFRVDRVINPMQCGMSGFSVSRFGSANLAAEFQDACGGGSAVMRKTG